MRFLKDQASDKTLRKGTGNSNHHFSKMSLLSRSVKSVKAQISAVRRLSKLSYFYLIPLSIYAVKVLALLIQEWIPGYSFITGSYIDTFISVLAVLYAIAVPVIFLREWEQLDNMDREFDKEADAIRILYDEVFFLRAKNKMLIKNIAESLQKYVIHVESNYSREIKVLKRNRNEQYDEKIMGDKILEGVREIIKEFIYSNGMRTKEEENFLPGFINRLDEIVDLRGNRIAIASQRLFETINVVLLITSIMFVLPFYFISFIPPSGVFDDFLTLCITLFVIIIYLFLEDLGRPFEGGFGINIEAWHELSREMNSEQRKLELESLGKPKRKRS